MSLGIAFKGPEGIVLAADSRVTLTAQLPNQKGMIFPATYDNATKLLRVTGQDFVGAITYGAGAIGQKDFRTPHSFMPEFEQELQAKRLSVKAFARRLGEFFQRQWTAGMPKTYKGPDMQFMVGGYDKGAPYGRVFQVSIPSAPKPIERNLGQGVFGISWGGQIEFTDRLIQGFDTALPAIVQQHLSLSESQRDILTGHLKSQLSVRIPYQFLPLQDCVDLSIFLIRTTMKIQTWLVGVRGVGGAIDVATITRTDGFQPVQEKRIIGEEE